MTLENYKQTNIFILDLKFHTPNLFLEGIISENLTH